MRTGRNTVCVRVRMIALLTGLPGRRVERRHVDRHRVAGRPSSATPRARSARRNVLDWRSNQRSSRARGGVDMRVLISGAGIAGPTLAYWLHRLGHQPTLVEL